MQYKPLYQIKIEHDAIINDLIDADGELTPEMIFALNINKEELQDKAESYALRIIEFNAQAELIASEVKRLQARAKHYEKTAEKLKETIQAAMVQFEVDKIKTEKVTLSFRKSEVVAIEENFFDNLMQFVSLKAVIDQTKVDAYLEKHYLPFQPSIASNDYLNYLKLSAEINKAKIKADLKSGIVIDSCMILDKKNLQIK